MLHGVAYDATVISCYFSLIMLFNLSLIYVMSLQLDYKLAKGKDPVLQFFVSSIILSTVFFTQ